MSRKIFYVAILVVLVASLVGCAPKAATTTTSGKTIVGLVLLRLRDRALARRICPDDPTASENGLPGDCAGSRP